MADDWNEFPLAESPSSGGGWDEFPLAQQSAPVAKNEWDEFPRADSPRPVATEKPKAGLGESMLQDFTEPYTDWWKGVQGHVKEFGDVQPPTSVSAAAGNVLRSGAAGGKLIGDVALGLPGAIISSILNPTVAKGVSAVTGLPQKSTEGPYGTTKYGTEELIGTGLMGLRGPGGAKPLPRVTETPHGTPGPEANASVAGAPPPTADVPPSGAENAAVRAPKPGPEDYSKKPPTATGEGAGVNVVDNGVDPTIASTFERSTPELDAAVRKATGTEAPPPEAAGAMELPEVEVRPEGAPPSEPAASLYHGTNREFTDFDPAHLQRSSGSYDAAHGFYFTDDPEVASFFADNPKRGRIIEAQLDFKNPKTIELDPSDATLNKNASIKEAFDAGHDAVIFKGSSEGKGPVTTTYVVPKTEQIKQVSSYPTAEALKRSKLAEPNRTLAAERPDEVLRGPRPGEGAAAPEMPEPTGGSEPASRVAPAEAGVPPSEKPTLHMPATKSDLAKGLFPSLRRMFMPMKSESAQAAGAALREAAGPLARLKEIARTRFTDDLHRVANKMDEAAFNKFVDAYESGQSHTLPVDQQRLAKVLEQNYGDFWKEIKKLPGTSQMEATKDFLTHMYDNSAGQVDKFVSDWHGGGGGSLRKRTHPTFADARAAGLKQLSNNPIEHFGRYAESISSHIAQRRVMADLEGQGRIVYSTPKVEGASGTPQPLVKGAPPEGYAEIKAPWAEKNGRRAYAPRDVAETLNQYYAAGMRNAATKDIYEFAQRAKNSWTALELGLSLYHGTTMGVEATNSGMARSMQMAARGDWGGAAKQLVKTPFESGTSYLYGRELRKSYRGEAPVKRGGLSGALDYIGEKVYGKHVRSPETQEIMDIFTRANVQPGNKPLTSEAISGATMREQDMSKLGNLWDAHKRGSLTNEIANEIKQAKDTYGLSIPKSTLDATVRGIQTLSKPLFEHYIPELKYGSMMKDMEAWLHSNPMATREQKLSMARKIADSTDNRMGEMNYDNLFINKTAKDLSMLALRSFAFTIGGPIREIGGGTASLARAVATGKNPIKHIANTPSTAYAMAFLPTIAAIGAAYQYLRTGKGPEEWRDLVTPKTGGTVKSVGQMVPERILVPGYHKDFLGYFVNPAGPTHELAAKLAAPWTALGEQITGKDWRDKDIVPPKASLAENIGARAKALGSHMLPIGPKQLAEGTKKGSALTVPEQMIGVRTPGAYMLNPKGLDRYLTNKVQKDWRGSEQQENRARRDRGLPPLPYRPPARGGQ